VLKEDLQRRKTLRASGVVSKPYSDPELASKIIQSLLTLKENQGCLKEKAAEG